MKNKASVSRLQIEKHVSLLAYAGTCVVLINPEPKARRINRVILSELLKVHGATSLAHKIPAYDGSKSLYTAGELPFKSMEFVLKLGRREIEYKVTIRYAARPNLYHLQQFLEGQQRDAPYDTIQALDVALRESPSLNYVTLSRSFFSKKFGDGEDIGGGLECWRGYYQSLRLTQMGPSLNIGKRSIYKITGITPVPLAQLSFSCNEGPQLTVVQYFAQQYNYRLRYTAWPCLQSGNDSKPIYLPMEVCQIIEGQRYPRKLSDTQVASILKATCKRPQEREDSIIKMVRHNNYSADRMAQVFGITVANQMANVQARVLPPPMLKYHESGKEKTVAPSLGQWNMINKKMVNGGTVRSWTCLSFSRIPLHVVDRICEDLAQMCNSIGMDFNPRPVTEVQSDSPNHIEAALRDVHMRAPNLQLLIVILPDISGHYGKIKRMCETDLGIVSQCINPKKNKTNSILKMSPLKSMWLHPWTGHRSQHIKHWSRAQAHREEIIQNLFWTGTDPQKGTPVNGGMIRELLTSFYKRTGRKPQRIIFYRDGEGLCLYARWVSTPSDICGGTEKAPHKAFPEVHGRRDLTDKSGNILPGTVVDTSICHPSEFDFYLCSHAGIKGTSRPTHYHVLYDENHFSADALQMLTNSLCYTYARCTRAVSVVPPAYYAHLAAFRARYYYDEQDSTDGTSVVSGGAAAAGGGPAAFRRLPQIKENVKEVMFFC
ncbi:unnamed protein product [Miscanthus lutarioriparius]|uniref:Uncharacterized protein n=1 Tax=Miscanthus lutarioriparius TaxID=422564 RepID=A0A811NGC3_9POAL|nr:unnamed protein product [Miscanthus lutarioriparius]